MAKWLSWLKMNGICHSFLSRGILLLSVMSIVIAKFPIVSGLLGSSAWRLNSMFGGSLLFLLGYVLAKWQQPPEFQGMSRVNDIVNDMTTMTDPNYFNGRQVMLRSLIRRMTANSPFDLPHGYLMLAGNELARANIANAHSLYRSDITLRQFDRQWARVGGSILLWLGTVMMTIPTALNVIGATWSILRTW